MRGVAYLRNTLQYSSRMKLKSCLSVSAQSTPRSPRKVISGGLLRRDEGEHPRMIRQACCLFLVLLSNTVLKSQCNKTGKRNKGTKIPKKEVKHSQM